MEFTLQAVETVLVFELEGAAAQISVTSLAEMLFPDFGLDWLLRWRTRILPMPRTSTWRETAIFFSLYGLFSVAFKVFIMCSFILGASVYDQCLCMTGCLSCLVLIPLVIYKQSQSVPRQYTKIPVFYLITYYRYVQYSTVHIYSIV